MVSGTVIGLASDGAPLRALVGDDEKHHATDRLRVLLIGRSEERLARIVAWFDSPASGLMRFTLAAVRDPAPDATYPPQGEAYAAAPEAHCLWRWIGLRAPDLVLIEGTGSRSDDLGSQLARVAAAGVGQSSCARSANLRASTVQASASSGLCSAHWIRRNLTDANTRSRS